MEAGIFQLCQLEIRFSSSLKEKDEWKRYLLLFLSSTISKETEASVIIYEIKTQIKELQDHMTGLSL